MVVILSQCEKESSSNIKIPDEYFLAALIENGVDYFLTGHYHQHTEENIGKGKLIVLGEWIKTFSYAVFDGKELELRKFN